MSDIVFILGAGASKSAGAPLMYDFLDRAEDLLDIPSAYRPDFDLVRMARRRLQVVHSKADLDLNNLESVLSAFDMAQIVGTLPGLDENDIRRLPNAARRVIAHTLERTVSFSRDGRMLLPGDYDRFAVSLSNLREKRGSTFSIITFNYDLAVDVALGYRKLPPNYCLGQESEPTSATLLKLHGSMNWVSSGQSITDHPAWQMLRNRIDAVRPGGYAPWTSWIAETTGMIEPSKLELAIIPPSWSKGQGFGAFAGPWRQAAVELSEATTIIISGFSLPESDSYFRYLFALGTAGHGLNGKILRQVAVIDPDPSVKSRFEKLLGQDGSKKLQYAKKPFGWVGSHLLDIVDGRTEEAYENGVKRGEFP